MGMKAQTATEYLIILAVVIVIALVAIAAMGGIPGIGKGASRRTSSTYWATSDIALTEYSMSYTYGANIVLKNNLRNTIQLTDVSVNEDRLTGNLPATLAPGEGVTVTGQISSPCTPGKSYDYGISITYEDVKTGFSTTLTGEGATFQGICAE